MKLNQPAAQLRHYRPDEPVDHLAVAHPRPREVNGVDGIGRPVLNRDVAPEVQDPLATAGPGLGCVRVLVEVVRDIDMGVDDRVWVPGEGLEAEIDPLYWKADRERGVIVEPAGNIAGRVRVEEGQAQRALDYVGVAGQEFGGLAD